MQQSKQEAPIYKEDEIDLRAFFNSLVAKKFLIASLTGFGTILAILYALTLSPTYQATALFTSPSEISVTTLNNLGYTNETKDSLFSKFLTQLSSKELQNKTFDEGDFLTLFNSDKILIDDVDAFISESLGSIIVNTPRRFDGANLTAKEMEFGFRTEQPYAVTMEAASAEAISKYLNALVIAANSKTIAEIIKHNKLKVFNRLDEISRDIDLILKKEKRERLNKIDFIKEEDGQKIRQINNQIDRERYKAKETRLNQITLLNTAAKLANSLGVIENNLNLMGISSNNSDLRIAFGEFMDLPEWYLYGEKALLRRVEILENRINDDPFIPELIILKNQLNEVQNNNLLKTLEMRQDDSLSSAEITLLEIEKIKLQSIKFATEGANSMHLIQGATIETFESKAKMIVTVAFIFSFMISIFLALIMGALKPNEKAPD